MAAFVTPASRGRRALAAAWWVVPSLFCVWLYWFGLRAWFQQDDFAWLQLRLHVNDWAGLWHALFAPSPHGTFRPLSERGYFLLFGSLFGLDAFPFRLLVFVTQFGNLVLLASIGWRLSGSRAMGFWAPVFWILNSSLVVPMVWTSAYMEILCGFCLLLAFHFFLRYIETGRGSYYALQWIPFLTGFLVMETTIVYPAIAAAFALLCARKYFRSTLPLFLPSAAFGVLHMALAPKQRAGLYSLHFDAGIFSTLATYWKWAFDPQGLMLLGHGWSRFRSAAIVICTAAVVLTAVWAIRKKQPFVLFFAAWFVIVLGPMLPLRDHLTPYYLTLPSIGTSMLLACALVCGWRGGRWTRAVSVLLLAGFALVSVRSVRANTWWWFARSRRAEAIARGLERARELHPQDTILLTGVDSDLFWSAISDGVGAAVGAFDVFLAPGSEAAIQAHAGMTDVGRFVLQPALADKRLRSDRLVVYDVRGPRMRAVTRLFRQNWNPVDLTPPRRLELGQDVVDDFLGPAWLAGEKTHRWMGKAATLRLAAPRSPAEKLHLTGYCPAAQVASGPLTMAVSVNGKPLKPVRLTRGDQIFETTLELPVEIAGQPSMQVEIEVDRTLRVKDREMGLAFSVIEVR